MKGRKRDISQKETSSLSSVGTFLLFVVAFLILLWVVIVLARIIFAG